jgi:pyruvate ferredoxin oxidoreductase delta subunit
MALKTWKELPIGCVVSEPGSASEYHTGSWRSQRPVWNNSKCIKCGICYVFARKAACSRWRTDFSRGIWIIARDAAFARMSAGRER